MSYNVKCPSCNAIQDVQRLKPQPDGRLRCSACQNSRFLIGWTHHSNHGAGLPPNPLPDGAYVLWGAKTKEAFGPGLLRGAMEEASQLRPGADAAPGGTEYTALQAGSSAAHIFIAKDDVMLKGQYYAGNGIGAAAGLTVMLLNGSGASIGHYMNAVITAYRARGASVLAVDYRGIGESSGTGTAHGLYTDAEAMLRYLTDGTSRGGKAIPADRVVVHGFSIGSAPATDLARHHSGNDPLRLGGLVLHCPISSFGSAAAYKQGQGASQIQKRVVKKVASWGVGFDNKKKLLHIDLPVHIVYARDDTFVDPADSRTLAQVQRAGATTIQAYRLGDHTDVGNIFVNANNTGAADATAPTTGTLEQFLTNLPRN